MFVLEQKTFISPVGNAKALLELLVADQIKQVTATNTNVDIY